MAMMTMMTMTILLLPGADRPTQQPTGAPGRDGTSIDLPIPVERQLAILGFISAAVNVINCNTLD